MGTVVSAVGTVAGVAGNLIGGSNSSGAAESTQNQTNANTMADKLALAQGFQQVNDEFHRNSQNSLNALWSGIGEATGYNNAAQGVLYGGYNNWDQAYNNGKDALTSAVNGYENYYNTGAGYLKSAIDDWNQAYGQVRSDESNYMALGQQGLSGYSGLLSDPSSVTSDPGYQFGLNQGVTALDRSAAAKGLALSGAQQKAIDQYGQDYASTKLDNILNRYKSAIDVGQTATTQVNNAGLASAAGKAAAYNSLANLGMTTASGEASTYNNLANLGVSQATGMSNLDAARANAYLNTGNTLASLYKASSGEYDNLSNLVNKLWEYTIGDWIGLDKDQNQTIASTNSAAASGQNNALSGAVNSLTGGVGNYLSSGGWRGGGMNSADSSLLNSYLGW